MVIMERDYGKEIDGLREQLNELKALIAAFTTPSKDEAPGKPLKNIHPMNNMHPDKRLSELMSQLCEKVDGDGSTGAIVYMGVYSSGGRQSNWIRNHVGTHDLLKLIESNTAAKVLSCIGSNDRLNMLLALLREPKTVAQLVSQCGYNTTGQVYHHLKPLLSADIVKEDENNRGTYMVKPHRVQGIIMLLAGISDMIDPQFTQDVYTSQA